MVGCLDLHVEQRGLRIPGWAFWSAPNEVFSVSEGKSSRGCEGSATESRHAVGGTTRR